MLKTLEMQNFSMYLLVFFAVARYVWSNVKSSSETVFKQLPHDEGQHTRDVGKSSAEPQFVWDLSCAVATKPLIPQFVFTEYSSHPIHVTFQSKTSSTLPNNITGEHVWVCCLVSTESE